MSLGDLATGGAGVGLVAVLYALRYYIPKWSSRPASAPVVSKEDIARIIEHAVEKRLTQELRNQKTIRELGAEARDDRMMECLTRMEKFQQKMFEDNMKMLNNMRDILRDIASSRGLRVQYYDKP